MKTLTFTAVFYAAIAAGLMVATVEAQYYTPLRYDLRMSSPTYIPGGTLQFGPADKANPYAFGQPQYGNLMITGNVRFGQSFQGNTPYSQTGDQLSLKSLPTTKLSNFTRDSYGSTDIGTGVTSYSTRPEVYFPPSGSVTNVASAMTAFAPEPPGPRAPYSIGTGLSTPISVTPTPTVGSFFSPATPPTGTDIQKAAEANGIAIPQETLSWLDQLIANKVPTAQVEAAALGGAAKIGPTGARGAEANKPGMTPYDVFEEDLLPRPDNIVNPNKKAKPPTAAEKASATEADAVLYWVKRGPPSAEEREAGTPPPKVVKTPTKWTPGVAEVGTEPIPAAVIAAASQPTPQPGTYTSYVERAHAAMRQGAYERAEALYSAAEVMSPNQPEAFFGRVNALLAVKNLLQASIVLQREFARHPDWLGVTPEIRLNYSPDTWNRLVTSLVAELKENPDSLDFNLLMGYVHFAAGAKNEAVYYLEKAAKARAAQPAGKEGKLTSAETLMLNAITGR